MSGGTVCTCPESRKPVKERAWVIYQYKCNHSAFSGYHYTPSDYSSVGCAACHRTWRTTAKYVDDLPLAKGAA